MFFNKFFTKRKAKKEAMNFLGEHLIRMIDETSKRGDLYCRIEMKDNYYNKCFCEEIKNVFTYINKKSYPAQDFYTVYVGPGISSINGSENLCLQIEWLF